MVRERGVQARRARGTDGERPSPPPRDSGVRFWQALAVIGLIAATAGWTTVAVIAFRPAATPPAVADVSPSDEPFPSDLPSDEPIAESHDALDMEGLLPAIVNGTTLTRQSWKGDTILGDDSGWSASITSFLTSAGKTTADLEVSQAFDDAGALDLSAGAFRATGIEGPALRDAILAAFKTDYADLKTATTKLGAFDVTSVDFGDGGVSSYWYVRGGVVFDIESGDQAIATAALVALPPPGAAGVPSSSAAAPPESAPSASAGPSPS